MERERGRIKLGIAEREILRKPVPPKPMGVVARVYA
jgi:hypothetical protein